MFTNFIVNNFNNTFSKALKAPKQWFSGLKLLVMTSWIAEAKPHPLVKTGGSGRHLAYFKSHLIFIKKYSSFMRAISAPSFGAVKKTTMYTGYFITCVTLKIQNAHAIQQALFLHHLRL